MGYKRRNAQLDHLTDNPPSLLRDLAIHELQPETIDDEAALKECHDHLSNRYGLLDRVIRARRLHASRFYALEMDYGHENFINQLSAQRTPLLRAIERLVKRIAELIYEKQKWFEWVRKLENEEEKERDAEKKKLKQEAAMFKRHMREVEARQHRIRIEEDQKQQAEFLERAWSEAHDGESQAGGDTDEDEWDPIEDNIEEERGNYISLLRHFLWQYTATEDRVEVPAESSKSGQDASAIESAETSQKPTDAETATAKSKNVKKKARQKAKVKPGNTDQGKTEDKDQVKPGTVKVESESEMRERLRVGEEYTDGRVWRKGGDSRPGSPQRRSPQLKPEDISRLISDVAEIKQLLFCRLILSHATLLPIALRSSSIDEFLANQDIGGLELRDLCLKMEQPELQVIRDACADLKREENEDDIDEEDQTGSTPHKKRQSRWKLRERIPKTLETKRERKIKEKREPAIETTPGELVNFGVIDDQAQHHYQRIKIKVCGKVIYNYPSETAMSRGGWLQFSVMANNCELEDAVALCRSWNEFEELVVLTTNNYFPASNWTKFLGGKANQQLFQLGFFPYFSFDKADSMTQRHQTGRHQPGPRQHEILEFRNHLCGIMRRNDPITRRFIQYMALQSCRVVTFVRDVKTGTVLVKPPEHELWLARSKVGLGRANKYDWHEIQAVGEEFFEMVDKHRDWSLNLKEYYEIIIWNLGAGERYPELFSTVQSTLFKAHRVEEGWEIFRPMEPILRSIAFDDEMGRAYDIQPGQEVKSMWDSIRYSKIKYQLTDITRNEDQSAKYDSFPPAWKYNESDRLEDAVLFAAEQDGPSRLSKTSRKDATNDQDVASEDYSHETVISAQKRRIHAYESSAPDMTRFILGLDTDDEMDDDEMEAAVTRLEQTGFQDEDHDHSDIDEDEEVENDANEEPRGSSLNEAHIAALRALADAHSRWRGDDGLYDIDDGLDTIQAAGQVPNSRLRKLQRQEEEAARAEVEDDFMEFVDRQRSVIFKETWHRTDLEPDAQLRWKLYQTLLTILNQTLINQPPPDVESLQLLTYTYNLLTLLEVDPECPTRTIKEAKTSCAFTSLFFDGPGRALLLRESLAEYKDSLLFKQQQRALTPPDRRSRMSNKTRPKEHYKEWDRLPDKWGPYPEEWHRVMRPVIALLYREGVICTSYDAGASGRAICLTEPERPNKPDLYFDWRELVAGTSLSIANPMNVQLLVEQARTFTNSNTFARFSLLRICSAPHFWPLMLGPDNRDNTSFMDCLHRTWQWKFIPKDMPFSEWSMHKVTGDRLNAFPYFSNPVFTKGSKVVHRIDTVLVMGKDIESCRFLTSAANFAIHTNPWRFEVDPWKSFINVDLAFFESLDKKWWD